MKMKEMVYGPNQLYSINEKPEILATGVYNCIKYYIINLGTHPAAYIENVFGVVDEQSEDLLGCPAYGGFTFNNFSYWDYDACGYWLGWDYSHLNLGDYSGLELNFPEYMRIGGKKWTTEEILQDVYNIINWFTGVE